MRNLDNYLPVFGGVVAYNITTGTTENIQSIITNETTESADFILPTILNPVMLTGLNQASKQVSALNIAQGADGQVRLLVKTTTAPITFASPEGYDVTNADTEAVPANPLRRYLLLTNEGTTNIFLAIGNTAVVQQGIVLFPGSSYEMTETAGNLSIQAIRAIGTVAHTALAYNEGI